MSCVEFQPPAATTFVIGGGVQGLALARELRHWGVPSVAILERGRVGESARGVASTAAMGLLLHPGDRRSLLGRLQRQSCERYESFCRRLENETGINSGYRRLGALHLRDRAPTRQRGRRLVESYARCGLRARWLTADDAASLVPGLDSGSFGAALHVPGEAVVQPTLLLAALRESCQRAGVVVREGVGDVRIVLGESVRIECESAPAMVASRVIATAGAWTTELFEPGIGVEGRVVPVRGQALALELDLGGAPAVHWSAGGGTYYLVPQEDGTTWAGSTVEHVGYDTATSSAAVDELVAAARAVVPAARKSRVTGVWSGLRPQARSRGGPFLGPVPGRRDAWLACGHYKSGILLAPLSAQLVAAQLIGDGGITPGGAGANDRPTEISFELEELKALWLENRRDD